MTPAPTTVRLTRGEFFQAAMAGMMRQISAIARGRHDVHGFAGAGWDLHVEGACGEYAVAKWANLFWNGTVGRIDCNDVGELEVRTTSHRSKNLILRPKDPDDRVFVSVYGRAPEFELVGWIHAKEGKDREHWREPDNGRPGAFFVAPEFLHPMELMKESGAF